MAPQPFSNPNAGGGVAFTGPTLVVVRAHETGAVFGGYTPLDWAQPAGMMHRGEPSHSSFVFALRGEQGAPQKWHPKESNHGRHVFCVNGCGPGFGSYGNDLLVQGDCDHYHDNHARLGRSYACEPRGDRRLAGVPKFTVADYEVFLMPLSTP